LLFTNLTKGTLFHMNDDWGLLICYQKSQGLIPSPSKRLVQLDMIGLF